MTHTSDTITRMLPRLAARARRLSPTMDEADDLAQEAALRLWQAMALRRDIRAPERYAMILLHNLARERWRNRRPVEELSEDMGQTAPAAPARLACAEARAAITRLPADQAALMTLVMLGETSPQVLASLTGLPKGTVMSRLARARARLRADLGLEGTVSELM